MTTYFVFLGIIAVVAWTIVLLDRLGSRREQRAHKKP